MKRLRYKRVLFLLLLPLAVIFYLISKYSPWAAEYIFARSYYHVFGNVIAWVSGLFPFSLAEFLVCAAPFVLLIGAAIWMVHICRSKREDRRRIVILGIVNVCCIASVIVFLIITFAMININRYSFTTYCGLETEEYSREELITLCESLIEEANAYREEVAEDADGVADLKLSFDEMTKEAKKAYANASKTYPVLDNVRINAKSVYFSKYMSYSGIIGVYAPFTVEANLDTDIMEYKQPATLCHEISHVQGFMREDEANYIAYLVCLESENPGFRYSGVMSVLSRCLDALYDQDPEAYADLFAQFSDALMRDAEANTAYWNEIYSSKAAQKVEKAVTTFNDSYLQASGQDGVQSYGLVVDLLLAQQRKEMRKDK